MFLFNRKKIINNLYIKAGARVLVSPLDWGLGHATRCIPIITALLSVNCEVFIAAEGATCSLLENEFANLNFLPLSGYKIEFSRNKSFFFWKILSQFPKIMYIVCYERRWLSKTIKRFNINVVISDNRVGLYNKKITSVYITHQLAIKTGNSFTSAIATHIHNHFIKKFDECWVPDFEKEGLAGELSHPHLPGKNVRYIGALSRLEKEDNVEIKYDLLIILSGPEPQRALFEKMLLNELLYNTGKVLLIRGLPGSSEKMKFRNNSVEIINHLSNKELALAIQQAIIVICRSGYTTIMDLVKLNKKAILVPTPGQAEQEYLARYLKERRMFFSVNQDEFKLRQTIKNFSEFKSSIPLYFMEQYNAAIKGLLSMEN